MQTNLELTNLINECLRHPINKDFKGNFETFTSILFSGDAESDNKVYTREEFLGLKPETNIILMLYYSMEDTIIQGNSEEFNRLCCCYDKIDFHWDEDSFLYHVIWYDNKEALDIMLSHGFEINDKCIEHSNLELSHLTGGSLCIDTIKALTLSDKLNNALFEPKIKTRGIKI